MAELLEEAAAPEPRFAAVVCEDIERSGRDTFNALKLERELQDMGVPLFATDEPASVQDISPTTVLVRRVKQGVAEYFRLAIKKKAWEGLRQHTLSGWNIGPAPYGYTPERVTHPVPIKAAQGRTKTRLVLDPQRGPVVARMFTWRADEHLGLPAITARLNAGHAAYPPPDGQHWQDGTIAAMLGNPKYTGYMVYGRRRKTGRSETRGPFRPSSGSGPTSPPTPRSSPGPCSTPPRRSPPPTAPPATTPAPHPSRWPAAPTHYADGSATAPASGACAAPPAPSPGTGPKAPTIPTPTTNAAMT